MDEIPQLLNVLNGDMSIIGPRPERQAIINKLIKKIPYLLHRLKVKPGITGWAQINGRNALSWEEKFELDLWYVENRTLWIDIKILFLIWRIFFI